MMGSVVVVVVAVVVMERGAGTVLGPKAEVVGGHQAAVGQAVTEEGVVLETQIHRLSSRSSLERESRPPVVGVAPPFRSTRLQK